MVEGEQDDTSNPWHCEEQDDHFDEGVAGPSSCQEDSKAVGTVFIRPISILTRPSYASQKKANQRTSTAHYTR